MCATASSTPIKAPVKKVMKTGPCNGRPWHRRGGMFVNVFGMALNNTLPALWLALSLETAVQRYAFLSLFIASCIGAYMTGKTTVYCVVVVPLYMCSFLLAFALPQDPIATTSMALFLGVIKVNICMSVCLHRYAAHAAFQCGTAMKYAMALIGCLANQGGPIWWGSQHRCHHKYCDVDRDPHSPTISGTERAFAFFGIRKEVEEDFAPFHMDSIPMRILDTWAFLVCSAELILSWTFFGNTGLFVSYVSAWLCQTITLWFNVVNHPLKIQDRKCKAVNSSGWTISYDECGLYLPFYFLDALIPFYASVVMEGEHLLHHDHAQLARRSKFDTAYFGFIRPLELMGLIRKVNTSYEFN